MSIFIWRCGLFSALALVLIAGGCSNQPSRVVPAEIDAVAAGKAAIAAYDKNGDGVISGDELDKCPALKSSLNRFDNNGDGKVTAETITARIQGWQETKVAATTVMVKLTLDDQKLEGATVTFDPEPFLGPHVLPASGVTSAQGLAYMTTDQKNSRGVGLGLYKVRISKKVDGQETIPARYNKDTELGVEVARDNRNLSGDCSFKLSSGVGK